MKNNFFLRKENVQLVKAEITLKIAGGKDPFCNNKMAEHKEVFRPHYFFLSYTKDLSFLCRRCHFILVENIIKHSIRY